MPEQALHELCGHLPPLYRSLIKIRPTQVADAALVAAIN